MEGTLHEHPTAELIREIAEANREYLRFAAEQIPAELREKFLSVVDWADRIEASGDVIYRWSG